MLLILFTIIIVALLTYYYCKPLIDNLLYSVPYEPKYIHSYVPLLGFGPQMFKDPVQFIRSFYVKYGKAFSIYLAAKRWVYFYDEQTYLTKVLKSPDLSIDEFFEDILINGLDIRRDGVINKEIQQAQLKHYHQYLVGDELEVLNERVHESLIESMKLDAKIIQEKPNKTANFFDLFSELMLYAGTEGLFGHSFASEQRDGTSYFYKLFTDFDEAYRLNTFRVPFRKILYKSVFQNRNELVKRISAFKMNSGESKLIQAREELYRCEEYKHLFNDYDRGALQASMLWAAVANTAPLSCWCVVDLLLHPEALEAVKQELKENVPSINLIHEKETLSKLKILESCITETIRRSVNTSSTRQAMKNTTVECIDKTKVGLRKGDMLVYPAYLKHFDPNLFGSNPYGYQFDRFVKKIDQPKAPSVMFFGCGTHTCPGRFWAMNEIKILVALIIEHMDIEFINMTEEDREEYQKKLPYDFSKFVSSGGPKKGYEHKFDIKYFYKNLDIN